MGNTICTLLGVVLLAVGLLGFVMPALLGAHLSPAHSVIHLATGAIATYLGLKGTGSAVRMFSLIFGAVYLLLGIAGFVAGGAGMPSAGMPGPEDLRLLKVIPGVLELGTVDHVIHIVLGAAFLLAGFATRRG